MPNTQSFWDQINTDSAFQITSLAESYLDLLRSAKTEWESRDYLIRKLFNYRFVELQRIIRPARGTGFIIELDDSCFAAGVFGRTDITKRGLSIITCPLFDRSVTIKTASTTSAQEGGTAGMRFTPANELPWPAWGGINVSLHIRAGKEQGRIRTIVSGESKKDSSYVILKQRGASTAKGKGRTDHYNLLTGLEGGRSHKGTGYPEDFLNALGIGEKELESSEISLVPTDQPGELGVDRSMVQGFGAYEWAAAFGALKTVTDLTAPEDTTVVIFQSTRDSKPGRKHMESIFRRVVEQIARAFIQDPSSEDLREVIRFSRIMDYTGLARKSSSEDSGESGAKAIPVGLGPTVGIFPQGPKDADSTRMLNEMVERLSGEGIPHMDLPRGYDFMKSDTAGSVFSKSVAQSIAISISEVPNEGVRSIISKLDLWALYRVMLVFLTV